MRRACGLAAMTAALLMAASVRAQPVPSLDLRNFRPPTDPRSSLYLEPSSTPGAGNWNVGAWLSYDYGLVTIEDASGHRVATPVKNQLSLDYLASLGIGDRLAVGLEVPTVLYQNGDDVQSLIGAAPLPHTAIGDVGFDAKASLLKANKLGGFGLAALADVSAPTGDRASYLGDGATTGSLRVLGDLNLLLLDVRAAAGVQVRSAERDFVGREFGHALPWGIGVTLRPQALGLDDNGRWLWTAEFHGAVALTPKFGAGPESPALAGLSARYTVGDLSTIAGVELPLDSAVGVPNVRAILGIGWAPRFYDEDHDGIPDDKDQCPELAEDKDGFQDADGCPDYDNDNDGVPDDKDACPNVPGPASNHGCPVPDSDGDGIPDDQDECPHEPGPAVTHGCPIKDTDGDGIPDYLDKCPNQPEDKDGFQDADGCPDPDNDHDGIPDTEDACPNVPGPRRPDPKLNGCPSPDKDGDTFDDKDDKCPDKPEDFNGFQDEDGCPDAEAKGAKHAKPLVTVKNEKTGELVLGWRRPPRFIVKKDDVELDPKTISTVRAMAQQLNEHPQWIMLIGVRPNGTSAHEVQLALNKSFVIVHALHHFTHRGDDAEGVGWVAVEHEPGAQASGIGVMVLGAPKP
jgi:OmpA-OmpF porin, OOP family